MSESTAVGVVRVDETLDWGEAEIPQSSAPVLIARLRKDPAGALTLAVRFPPGWERAVAGHYEVEETFVVLEGAIELNGRRYGVGELVVVPARVPRTHTATPAGSICLARFAGPPRWSNGAGGGDGSHGSPAGGGGGGPSAESGHVTPAIVSFATTSANGRLLLHRHEDGSTSWLVAASATGRARSDTEVVLPRSFGWAFVEPGGTLPTFSEPAVLRETPGEA